MRNPLALCLLLLLALLGGCLETAHDPDGDGQNATSPPPEDGDGGTGLDDKDSEGEATDSGPGDEPDEEPDDDQKPCHERDPPFARPDEQRVETLEDIRCPGQYAVIDNGTDPAAQIPDWNPGDWWRYRGEIIDPSSGTPHCAEYYTNVTGETNEYDTDLHVTELTPMDCNGNAGESRTRWYTKDTLSWMLFDGFTFHRQLFPLADDKHWAYMERGQRNIVNATVTHEPAYQHGDEELEVWRIERTGTSAQGNDTVIRVWYSPDAGNILREERLVNGVRQYAWHLIDSIHGHGDDSFLPG